MEITFFGHSCFLLNYNGKNLLFDPFISGNELASHIDIDSIPCDYILLSHGHFDHIADAERIANRTGAKLIGTYEIVTHYGKKKINGHPMNIGGAWDFDFGNVKMTQSVHTSSYEDGSYAGHSVGFVISGGPLTIYFSGDTGLTLDMKLIPMTSPKLDYAILPIGDNFTMGYQDAIIAANFIQCKKIIACHYDTFGYIKVDQSLIKNAFEADGKQIQFLEIGKPVNI